MNKILTVIGMFFLFSGSASAQYSSTKLYPSRYSGTTKTSGSYGTSAYWDYVNNYYKQKNTVTTRRSTPAYTRQAPTYSRIPSYRTRYSTSNPYKTPSYGSRFTRTNTQQPVPTSTTRKSVSPWQNTGRTSSQMTRVSFTPLPQRKALESIDTSPIDLFEVGVHNERGNGATFQEAVIVDTMTFQMYARSGVAVDPQNFELVVGESTAPFNSNGEVTISFDNGVRVASSQSKSFTVQVRVRDPENLVYSSGNFRLRALNADVKEELSRNSVATRFTGSTSSSVIAFDPIGQPSFGNGPAVFTTVPRNSIQGGNLTAGQKVNVLALEFNAYFDNLYVRELILTEKNGKDNVDTLIEEVMAVDRNTGEVFDRARFVNGKAKFDFNHPIYIARQQERDIIFVAIIASPIPRNVDPSFQLNVPASGLDVISYSNGNRVNLSSQNITIEEDIFTVVNSDVNVTYQNQLSSFVVTGDPQAIMRFQVNNPGNDPISIRRMSFDVFPSGIVFPGGISTDDFELVALRGGGSEPSSPQFTPTAVSGSSVTFDTNSSEITIQGGASRDFLLKAAFDDIGNIRDTVGVRMKKDSSPQKGTKLQLEASGAQFIWSDYSGRPHTRTSSDYLNSYQINGVGTTVSIRR